MSGLTTNPELLALATLVVGVVAAFAARAVVSRVAARSAPGLGVFVRIVRTLPPLTFWGVLALAVGLSLRVLGVGQATWLVDQAWIHLPRVVVAVFVVYAGHLVGGGLRELVQRHTRAVRFPPGGAYWLATAPAVLIAAQQLGIDVSFVADLTLVTFGIGSAALGLAFALGARRHVANLIARRELNRYREGDLLRIDGIEGSVVEMRRTGLVLSTAEGLAHIPAARFAEVPVVRLAKTSE